MQTITVDPRLVEVSDRLRAVDPDFVAILASSMDDRGLDSPIRVTVPAESGACRLIAGAHRLAAGLSLGWTEMTAIPFTGDALQAELLEIEENLFRRELSELDRSTFLARHKSVWEALHPEVKHGGDRRKKQVDKDVHLIAERFSAVAAAKFGFDERTIRRLVRRNEALSPLLRARIAGTWISDNGAALDALIGAKEEERGPALDLLLAAEGGMKNVAAALAQVRKLPAPDLAEEQLRHLMALWRRTAPAVQDRFLQGIGAKRGKA